MQVFIDDQKNTNSGSVNIDSVSGIEENKERDINAYSKQSNENQDLNRIVSKTLQLSNVVEGNDIFLHDVLSLPKQPMCNFDNVSSGNDSFESSTTPQAANLSQEPTLSFECHNDDFITPCSRSSLEWQTSKRKQLQLGESDT